MIVISNNFNLIQLILNLYSGDNGSCWNDSVIDYSRIHSHFHWRTIPTYWKNFNYQTERDASCKKCEQDFWLLTDSLIFVVDDCNLLLYQILIMYDHVLSNYLKRIRRNFNSCRRKISWKITKIKKKWFKVKLFHRSLTSIFQRWCLNSKQKTSTNKNPDMNRAS